MRDSFTEPAQRTAVFAAMDLAVNVLTLGLQLLLTGRLVQRLGLGWTLALLPVLLAAVSWRWGCRRYWRCWWSSRCYAAPATTRSRAPRARCSTSSRREEKYKAKNFIDTVVYRGGDAVSGWAYAGAASSSVSACPRSPLSPYRWPCFGPARLPARPGRDTAFRTGTRSCGAIDPVGGVKISHERWRNSTPDRIALF